jgi:GMP synthase-like glutamine amidotransferase
MIRLHYIQHVSFEGLGFIETYSRQKGFTVSKTRIYAGEFFPEADKFDWLVIMGGPMSIYEENIHPWIIEEKKFIEQAIKHDKTVIGVCLGAQMIASVLGANVFPNINKEIGWFPVTLTPQASSNEILGKIPESFMAFHWHGDTFDIPSGAVHCASSEACANQAFVYDNRVVGLQFHCESTVESIENIIANCADEIKESRFIQGKNILHAGMRHISDANANIRLLLDGLLCLK